MKSKFTAVFILVITIVSCRKSNTTTPATPAVPESLMNWTFVDSLPDKNGDDIWFTSATNGIFISVKLYETSDGGVTWRDSGLGSGSFFNLFFTDAQHGFA